MKNIRGRMLHKKKNKFQLNGNLMKIKDTKRAKNWEAKTE